MIYKNLTLELVHEKTAKPDPGISSMGVSLLQLLLMSVFCLSPEYRAKIEGSQPLLVEVSIEEPGLDLEKNKEEVEEGDDDEDLPAELAKSVVIGEKLLDLPPGYSLLINDDISGKDSTRNWIQNSTSIYTVYPNWIKGDRLHLCSRETLEQPVINVCTKRIFIHLQCN